MLLSLVVLAAFAPDPFDPGPNPLLMRNPTVNGTHIAFEFAGDLWRVARSGGRAERLTRGPGPEMGPRYSPDGEWLAFSGQYDGNTDAFVVAADGGVPRRLTAHPLSTR